jgi:phosphoribosyl 1,2-cyclic phosphodiesterase
MNSWRLQLKLWGVRGSIPTPNSQNLGYGGNTACVEVRLPNDDVFVFDAGSGIRNLGISLQNRNGDGLRPVNLFLTHFHWDHIQGLPFFGPLYNPASAVTFYSSKYSGSLHDSLAGQMSDPYFPVKFDTVSSKREFVDLGADPVRIGGLTVHPFPLKHPQGASGYRIEANGAVIVYATDREHGDPRLDAVLREYSQGADILIHDAQYTLEEYGRYRGWGHSTWQEAVHVARDSNVKKLILFHHDPAHDDETLSRIVEETRQLFPDTLGACEGWVGTL